MIEPANIPFWGRGHFEKTCCHDTRSVPGSKFWHSWPLPYLEEDFLDEWSPPPSSAGTFYKSAMYLKCQRVVLLEGAIHNGSTYSTLGTQSIWLRAKAPETPEHIVRPAYMRGEKEVARWSTWNPKTIVEEGDPTDVRWVKGGSISFGPLDKDRIWQATIMPQSHGMAMRTDWDGWSGTYSGTYLMGTLAAAAAPGDLHLDLVPSDPLPDVPYNDNGFMPSYTCFVRAVGEEPIDPLDDSTIYPAGQMFIPPYLTSVCRLPLHLHVQKPLPIGQRILFVQGLPVPAFLPHDILLHCEVFYWRKMSREREETFASDPLEWNWVYGSKTTLEREQAGVRISPHLFYWRCEPRSYYPYEEPAP